MNIRSRCRLARASTFHFVLAAMLSPASAMLFFPDLEPATSGESKRPIPGATDYALPTISQTANGFTADTQRATTTIGAQAPTPMPGCIDVWAATSTADTPAGRSRETEVWTGSEMIVWGGFAGGSTLNTGGKYNPSTDRWTSTSTTNAPSDRSGHTAVWTGSEMIVWGGGNAASSFNTGGRYNPSTNSWIATSTTNAPAARNSHTAIWTGSEMIVWGGAGSGGFFINTGGRYNPETDSWTPTSTTKAPAVRIEHTTIWTGSEMIVWGGLYLNTGGRYNPSMDSWTATSTTNAPDGRLEHTAVWTGSEMIVWGGFNANTFNTGGRYNPGTDSWTSTSTTNAPSDRSRHTAVWTGSEMIVWGGYDLLNTGGRYDPGTNTWTATSTNNAPVGRYYHTAIWTGSEMVVWGGFTGTEYTNTGGKYCAQSIPTPTPTSTPATLGNISTRLQVGTADRVLIAGFIVQGSAPKRVIIRAVGPSLGAVGVRNALVNPRLELHDASSTIGTNDDWQTTQIGGVITEDQVAEIQSSGLAPSDSAESAIIATLSPGAYTAIVEGVNGGTGVGLVEVYDLNVASSSLLANISTRGFVQTADGVMIGGFIVVTQPARVVIRAIGPSLSQVGVPDALVNPQLELHDTTSLIGQNDNWQTTQIGGIITMDQVAEIQQSGLAPTDSAESAIIATLQPGSYTAVVRGVNSTAGNGLVEVYRLP
jgi:N-acetylneuraminic acid mutarotase